MAGTVNRSQHPIAAVARGLCLFAALTGLATLTACEEIPADAPPRTPPAATPPPAPPRPLCDATAPLDPGPAMPRRLTTVEYHNTVRDLLGVELGDAITFPPDEESLGFDNNARALQVGPLHTERYMAAAEAITARIRPHLADHLPCDPAEADPAEADPRACAARFIEDFGRRAWRRPLSAQERGRLLMLYDAGERLEGPAFETGVTLVIEAMLQSPNFLFRIERGDPDPQHPDLLRLDDHTLASRLSYLIWRSMPDDLLFAAVDAGELSTPAQIGAQAERMLQDPRAREAWWTFFAQWLHLDAIDHLVRDPRVYPGFGDAERDFMTRVARAFVEDAAWGGDLRQLFDGAFTHPSDPPTAAPRAGILSLPGLLAVTSTPVMTHPILRGLFVREQLLCTALPPPPPDLAVTAPDPDPTLTTRQQFAEHTSNEACQSCHALIDPIGFGFEHFDAVGDWRAAQNGHPVDAAGALTGTDVDGDFYGVDGLATRLARSEDAHRCVATQVFRYAYGRGETPADGCALEALYRRYADAGYDFGAMIRALVVDETFRYRRGDPT